MVIPVIIMGGILTGWFTPTEAGMAAAAYILLVLIPVMNPRHIRRLPGDFMYTGLLYSLPLAAVAAASAFGWMLAYLRGPTRWPSTSATTRAPTQNDHASPGHPVRSSSATSSTRSRPSSSSCPSSNKLTQVGNINPVHMGVVIITTLVFGLITRPTGCRC